MSIFIQFVKDNLAMFVVAIVAVVVLIAAIVAMIIVKRKLKSALAADEKLSGANEVSVSSDK